LVAIVLLVLRAAVPSISLFLWSHAVDATVPLAALSLS
jgi:hypothetical protein